MGRHDVTQGARPASASMLLVRTTESPAKPRWSACSGSQMTNRTFGCVVVPGASPAVSRRGGPFRVRSGW